jgi:hypothetical protein
MREDQYIEAVLTKCNALKRAGFWAAEPKIRPAAWLENFQPAERAIAAVLLDHFVFFSSTAVDKMLVSGYRALRDLLVNARGKATAVSILKRAIFTAVEGESPNVTDSGKLFCRKLRQILDIEEDRFLEPRVALQRAAAGVPIVFLDDFVGSGKQFTTTWQRLYSIHAPRSFQEAHVKTPFPVLYLNLVTSTYGLANIQAEAPSVPVVATHVLNDEYSVRKLPRSRLLPDIANLQAEIEALLEKYYSPLRVPPYFTTIETRKYGFHKLGFLVAFDHSTPDSTVPLLWAEGPGSWTPLVRRT